VQAVGVVKREGAEPYQQQPCRRGSPAHGARHKQQDCHHKLNRNYCDGRRPLPAFVVEFHRREQLADFSDELAENPKLRAGRK
jgi:hypothetical protein